MIKYDLQCANGHLFESWFRSSSDYDMQSERGLASCLVCQSTELTKRLMALAEKHAGGRVVSVLEGGYNVDGLASAVSAHLKTLSGKA